MEKKVEEKYTKNEINDELVHITKVYGTYMEFISDIDKIANGMIVKTLGYYIINDFGAACYYITNKIDINEYQEPLADSGLFAQLIYNDVINVMQFGIKNDNTVDISEKFQKVVEFAELKKIKIIVPPGEYLFNNNINVENFLYLEGYNRELVTFNIKDSSKNTFISLEENKIIKNIRITDITFNYIAQIYGSNLKIEQGTFIRMFNCVDSYIKNCKIINEISDNCLNLIWIREGTNINIENNILYNLQGNIVGGSIWLWTYSDNNEISNISIENNIIKQNTKDEVIAIWGNGRFFDITIENNVIDDLSIKSVYCIGVYGTSDKFSLEKLNLINNIINIKGNVSTTLRFQQDSNSNVKDILVRNNLLKYLNNEYVSQSKAIECSNLSNIEICDNQFESKNNPWHFIISNLNSSIMFNNNIINNSANIFLKQPYNSFNQKTYVYNNIISIVKRFLSTQNKDGKMIAKNNEINIISEAKESLLYLGQTSNYIGDGLGTEIVFENNNISANIINIIDAIKNINITLRNNNINANSIYIIASTDNLGILINKFICTNNEFNGKLEQLTEGVGIFKFAENIFPTFNNNTNIGNSLDFSDINPIETDITKIYRVLMPVGKIIFDKTAQYLGWQKTESNKWICINNMNI